MDLFDIAINHCSSLQKMGNIQTPNINLNLIIILFCLFIFIEAYYYSIDPNIIFIQAC